MPCKDPRIHGGDVVGWFKDIQERRKRRAPHLLTDIRVKKIDLVGVPAIGRAITLFKAHEADHLNDDERDRLARTHVLTGAAHFA